MKQEEVTEALTTVIRTLSNLQIPYYIGGSVASSVYGAFRATRDVDIVSNLRIKDVDNFVDALKEEYYVDRDMIIEAIRRRSSFNVIHLKTMFKIDIFILKERQFDKTALKRKREDTLSGASPLKLFISSPEDIILHKLEWYKLGGCISERQIEDIKNIILVQAKNLDMPYINQWADKLGVSEILEKLLKEIAGLS
ncbi:MAG: hypothetical protein A3F16_00135 [Deltaproteobacteria bacterium RIFCSPHIGHO2_12_FULL_43_9]|nr:MAG: hypothetical protein A3F16_00135 [Deltaproteobacteria bacterium RIFCSPHIGHO2_12_FULL_43_9]